MSVSCAEDSWHVFCRQQVSESGFLDVEMQKRYALSVQRFCAEPSTARAEAGDLKRLPERDNHRRSMLPVMYKRLDGARVLCFTRIPLPPTPLETRDWVVQYYNSWAWA